METLRMAEDVESKDDRLALELLLDALEGLLHAEPEVDLLARGPARDVAVELRDILDLLDPAVDLSLELVQESRVAEETRLDRLDCGAVAGRLRGHDRSRDGGVEGEHDLWDLDVLLDCLKHRVRLNASPFGE